MASDTTLGVPLGLPALGINFTDVTSDAKHTLGMTSFDNRGRILRYVKCGGSAINAGVPLTIDSSWVATASGNAGTCEGASPHAMTANYHSWVVIKGRINAEVASTVAAGERLSLICDANGDLVEIPTTIATSGDNHCRAIAKSAHASGEASVELL